MADTEAISVAQPIETEKQHHLRLASKPLAIIVVVIIVVVSVIAF